ncbi:MAG: exodeoxyribonuclease VII large subunit [Labilithrix sp.]|nr:exodeoxyribonuclease VII large subunit [Labilithrix sp.]
MERKRPKPGESLSFDWTLPPVERPRPPAVPPEQAPTPDPTRTAPELGSVARQPASAAETANARESASAPWAPPLPERPPPPAVKPERRVFTVGELGRIVGRSLERAFAAELWVEGEVGGARPASSGHVYFSLKDEREEAAIDVVLYRSQVTPRGRALIKDGARVRVRGKPTYWSPRGKLQFVGDRVEPTGKGALLEALEQLKQKLQAEGLFAPEKKRPLPHDPRVVGVVTSAQGAVIHDICKVAFRRGGARILLAPAQVQGAGAATSIRRALRMLQRVADVDVIVVGRGGGSQDDLLAFNDEALVRDVAACRVPIVSAVGHEVDVTLVDFAADARAATPSQAAEMIVPDATARRRLLDERTSRLRRAMHARIAEERVVTGRLAQAFGDPRLLIASAQQRVDEHVMRLGRILAKRLAREQEASSRLGARLGAAHPRERIARDRARVSEAASRLVAAARADARGRSDHAAALALRLDGLAPRFVRERSDRVAALAGRLDAMSPLKVLARGYAIVTRSADGRAVRDAAEVAVGDALHVRVASGAFDAEVTRADRDDAASPGEGGGSRGSEGRS